MTLYRGSRYGEDPPTVAEAEAEAERRRSTRGSDEERQPLGVDRDYTAMVQARYGSNWQYPYLMSRPMTAGSAYREREQGPRYFDGDEFKPGNWGSDAIVSMQQALVVAGFLPADSKFRLGDWRGPTVDAYRELLEYANQHGLTEEAALRMAAESGGGGGAKVGGGEAGGFHIDPNTGELVPNEFVPREALPLNLPSREDLQRTVRNVVSTSLGVGWDRHEIDRMVDLFIERSEALAQQAYNREVARDRATWESGGVPNTDVDIELELEGPESFAEGEVERIDPAGVQAADIGEQGGYADAFFDALGGLV